MLGGAAGFVEGGGLRGSLGASGRVYYAYANGEIAPGPRGQRRLIRRRRSSSASTTAIFLNGISGR